MPDLSEVRPYIKENATLLAVLVVSNIVWLFVWGCRAYGSGFLAYALVYTALVGLVPLAFFLSIWLIREILKNL